MGCQSVKCYIKTKKLNQFSSPQFSSVYMFSQFELCTHKLKHLQHIIRIADILKGFTMVNTYMGY